MAKRPNGVNKSEEIRQLLKANPQMKARQIVAALDAKGIPIAESMVYFVKGRLFGKKRRAQRNAAMIAKVGKTMNTDDALAAILKIKRLAAELGGLKKLQALVEALSE